MKLPEAGADRYTTIDRGAYRDIVDKRPNDRFDATQVRWSTDERCAKDHIFAGALTAEQ
jgi:hypothetical protein